MFNLNINYFMTTFPLDKGRTGVTIGTPSLDSSIPDFYIRKGSFTSSTVGEVSQGQIELTYQGFQDVNFYSYVKEGDCIRIFEVFGDTPLSQTQAVVFTGYVASIRHDLDMTQSGGLRVTLFFYNLLGQWNSQATLSSFNQQASQGLTNGTSNLIPLGQVLTNLVQGSLFQKFIDLGLFSITSQNYKGQQLPVIIGTDKLNLSSLVWTYIPANLNKLDTLRKVLFPYQFIFYQQPNGVIVLDLLKPKSLPNSPFTFSYGASSNPQLKSSSKNFLNVQVTKAACLVPNKVLSTLINPPWLPPTDKAPINVVAEIENPFTRPKALADSGYFELFQVDVESLNDGIIADPTLLSYASYLDPNAYSGDFKNSASSVYALTTISGNPSVAATYAARRLAQMNAQETIVTIRQARAFALNAGASPLGYMVNVNFPGMLDSGENSLYCYETITEFDVNAGTTFTMNLIKPGSVTAYWENAS